MEAITDKDRQRIAWVKSFESGKKWFLKLQKQHGEKLGTQKVYSLALEQFCEYINMTPDEIIGAYTKALDQSVQRAVEEWNDKLDLFVPWLEDTKKVKRSVAANRFAAIKSFFANNTSIGLTTKTPESYSEQKKPVTIEDLRERILPYADIFETLEILFLKDSGISQDDALKLNVGNVEDLGNGFGYVPAFRGKEGVDYETFIGPNAMEAMKRVIDHRKRLGIEITPDSPLFVKKTKPQERQSGYCIRANLTRLSRQSGVQISTHRLRKSFETYLALAKVHPIILKYWMGHKVAKGKRDIEAKYIIPPKTDQLKAYMEAYRAIDVSTKPAETDAAKLVRMELLKEKARSMGFSEEELDAISVVVLGAGRRGVSRDQVREVLRGTRRRTIDEQIKYLEKLIAERQKRTEHNGGDCGEEFEQIKEEELLSHLKAGWSIVHRLQSGEVILKR